MANKPALVFTHEGKQIKNYGKIISNMHYEEIKHLTIEAFNQSKNTVQDIKIISNMPADAWTVDIPKQILPNKKGQIGISLNAKKLFDDDSINAIGIEFEYNEVKTIEVR